MTSAPSWAGRTAWLRPCPRAAPVMIATRPSSLPVLRALPGRDEVTRQGGGPVLTSGRGGLQADAQPAPSGPPARPARLGAPHEEVHRVARRRADRPAADHDPGRPRPRPGAGGGPPPR